MEIKFLQSNEQMSIREHIQYSIEKSISIKGTVAFWTINTTFFKGLSEKLASTNSYVCVDIHKPTDIDSLNGFVEKGANIYLFMYRKDNGKFPLMHAKFLMFEFDDEQVEIWLGSQNFTESALEGKNIESTTVISTSKNSELYKQINEYLQFIKDICGDIGKNIYKEIGEKFNHNYIDFYKKLQGSFDFQETTHQVMDIVCTDVKQFSTISTNYDSYTFIAIYSDNVKKLRVQTGKDLLIRALDNNGHEICYRSRVFISSARITPTEGKTNTPITTCADQYGKQYIINSFIISENNSIPAIVDELPKGKYPTIEFVVKIADEFTDELKFSQKTEYWKKLSDFNRESSPYLNLIVKNNKEIKIPKSPEDVRKESTYPFDKLGRLDMENRIIKINNAKKGISDTILRLGPKQPFIRDMVTSEKETEKNNKKTAKKPSPNNDLFDKKNIT